MARFLIFVFACALAAIAPFWFAEKQHTAAKTANLREFQTEFESVALKELPLTEREQVFLADFPGRVGRFSDGQREIIFRYVTSATRKLHPASDCFAAIGYKIKPLPLKVDQAGNRWRCFAATKNNESLRVCERIYNAENAEQNWTDVSAWYWSALSETRGEWWAVTVAEREN